MKKIILIGFLFLSLFSQAQNMMFFGQNQNKFDIQTIVQHTRASDDLALTIGEASGGGDVLVLWGDNTSNFYGGGITAGALHIYSGAGTYDVIIYSRSGLISFDLASQGTSSLDISQSIDLEDLICPNNNFTTLSFNASDLDNVDLRTNILSVAAVNFILEQLDGNGISNGICRLNGQVPSAPPSGAGITAKNNLISKGWTVTTD